jgi:TRAP transporter TAXI family solute receptor
MQEVSRTMHRAVIALVLSLMIAACGGAPAPTADGGDPAPATPESVQKANIPVPAISGPMQMKLGTGSSGGVYAPYGQGIVDLLNNKLPGAQISVFPTSGSVDNLKYLKSGEIQIGIATVDSAWDASKGAGVFRETGPVEVRTIAVLYPSYIHIIASVDSGITKVADLKGKRVSLGAAGSSTEVSAERIMKAAGLDPSADITRSSLGVSEAVDQFRAGNLDAFFWNGGLPTAAIDRLIAEGDPKVIFLPTEEFIPAMVEKYGPLYSPLTPGADVYGGIANGIPGIGLGNILVVNANMPDDQVYAILATIFNNLDMMQAVHPEARKLSLNTAASGSSVEFHPGAIKFYQDQGVWSQR